MCLNYSRLVSHKSKQYNVKEYVMVTYFGPIINYYWFINQDTQSRKSKSLAIWLLILGYYPTNTSTVLLLFFRSEDCIKYI